MSTAKIAISINSQYLARLEQLVKLKVYKNRSQAIEQAVIRELGRLDSIRLAEECDKLDVHFERELAEEGLKEDERQWPEY